MLMLLIRLFDILMLSTFELITFFWNQGVYTPTLKKHQVVRDLKKFENHWSTRITWSPRNTKAIAFCSFQKFTISVWRSSSDVSEMPYVLYAETTFLST